MKAIDDCMAALEYLYDSLQTSSQYELAYAKGDEDSLESKMAQHARQASFGHVGLPTTPGVESFSKNVKIIFKAIIRFIRELLQKVWEVILAIVSQKSLISTKLKRLEKALTLEPKIEVADKPTAASTSKFVSEFNYIFNILPAGNKISSEAMDSILKGFEDIKEFLKESAVTFPKTQNALIEYIKVQLDSIKQTGQLKDDFQTDAFTEFNQMVKTIMAGTQVSKTQKVMNVFFTEVEKGQPTSAELEFIANTVVSCEFGGVSKIESGWNEAKQSLPNLLSKISISLNRKSKLKLVDAQPLFPGTHLRKTLNEVGTILDQLDRSEKIQNNKTFINQMNEFSKELEKLDGENEDVRVFAGIVKLISESFVFMVRSRSELVYKYLNASLMLVELSIRQIKEELFN